MPEQPVDPNAGHATPSGPAVDAHAGQPPPPAITGETAPPEAFVGPRHAADTIYDPAAMARARAEVHTEHGAQRFGFLLVDRIEYQLRDGDDGYLWDAQGWYGGDLDKLWLKTEGEGAFDDGVEEAEIQALWSRAIGPFFDLQLGTRYDLEPRSRGHLVAGVQGLAPYFFEVDAAAFLSDRGDLTARVEAEYDQRITQRLILQPRAEASLAAQDVPELGVGAGLDEVELGLRLRYEITRELAPYAGVEQRWRVGDGADFARAAGKDTSSTSFVFGVRAWF